MPRINFDKLNIITLISRGKNNDNDINKELTYEQLRDICLTDTSLLNDDSMETHLYGSGKNNNRKRKHDDDDDDFDQLSMREKEAKLHDYYNMYKKYELKRLRKNLRSYNPVSNLSENDYYNIRTYLSDYENDLLKGGGERFDLRLKVQFSALLIGKSKSGKTTLLLEIIEQWRSYTTDSEGLYERRIFWFYGTENAKDFHNLNEILYKNAQEYNKHDDKEDFKPRIEFMKGDFKNPTLIERIKTMPEQSIVILDDLMSEMVKSEDISNILTRESHHRKWCVFLLWQDMYPQQQFARTISMQVDYKYIFRDPSRGDRLMNMCKQMFQMNCSEMAKKLNDYFHETPTSEYPYLRINVRPDSPHAIMVIANDLIRNKENARFVLPEKPPKLFTLQ